MLLAVPDRDVSLPRIQWADWLELSLLFSDDETISKADITEALELYFEEDDLSELIESIFAEITIRQTLIAANYPFEQRETHVARARPRQDAIIYSFLLALGTKRYYNRTTLGDGEFQEPARLFEYVVAAALRQYLNGLAVRIGTHRESPLPTDFAACLAYLEPQLKEAAVRPLNPTVGNGDQGCDVVAWVPLPDGRPGQVVVLAQCAIGESDWNDKLPSLTMEVWGRQFRWHVDPIRAFAVPFLHGDDEDQGRWHWFNRQGGIHLDRLRIACLVGDVDVEPEILSRLRAWCDQFAQRLA